MTPVEEIRRAAQLMRERAEVAAPGPYEVLPINALHDTLRIQGRGIYAELNKGTAPHIASWHPGVALAVADWLDDAARAWTDSRYDPGVRNEHHAFAIAAARVYLGGAT